MWHNPSMKKKGRLWVDVKLGPLTPPLLSKTR
jgi:hypothetical protein